MHSKQIKMHGAWIPVVKWWKTGIFPTLGCKPMRPRYLLAKPPKVMLFSLQYVKICISTAVQLCVWHRPCFKRDTHLKMEIFVFRSGPHRLPWQHNIWTQCVTQQQFSSSFFNTSDFFFGGGGGFFMFFFFFYIVFYLFFPSHSSHHHFSQFIPLSLFLWKNIPDALLSFSETWCLFSVS